MNRIRLVLLAGLLALSFAAGAAAQTSAHSYYTRYVCFQPQGLYYREHMHGIYDVAGREVGHSAHYHYLGYC